MKSILVIGMGRFGRHCVQTLVDLGHDVMALDDDEKNIDVIADIATNCQIGDATDELFMKSLGISDFDVCIVAIGDDFQSSLEATYLCKKLGCDLVVARANRDVHAEFLKRNGADEVVYPEKQIANWTAVTYSSEHIFDYIQLDEEHAIYELDIPESWLGKTILEVDVRKKYGINILSIKENGVLNMNITPNTLFKENMRIYVLGDMKTIKKCFKL